MLCGSIAEVKFCNIAFRKHLVDKMSIFPAIPPQPKYHYADRRSAAAAAHFYTNFPGDKPVEHPAWISDRRAFRQALDGMGNLRKWLNNKPILTDLEVLVMERDRRAKRILPSLPPEPSVFTTTTNNSRCALKDEVEEVKSFLRMHETCDLSELLDWDGTGKLKLADICNLFKKEDFFISPKRLDMLMSSLNCKDGDSVTVKDLADGIQAWSRKHQEREDLESNPDEKKEMWLGPQLTTDERDEEEGLQDVEVLSIMRRVMTSCPSTMYGSMARQVDCFRKLCFNEYLKTLQQCQQEGLNVSQATLQKGDKYMSSSFKLGGKANFLVSRGQEQDMTSINKPKTHGDEDGEDKCHKDLKKQSIRWADPNAFWPGTEDHVRFFLPARARSPALVLFQRIEHSVVPSRGHWPINHLGYVTYGDIEARKMYTL